MNFFKTERSLCVSDVMFERVGRWRRFECMDLTLWFVISTAYICVCVCVCVCVWRMETNAKYCCSFDDFALMMTSNQYEDLSIVIIFLTPKMILKECFSIQNFGVETYSHENNKKKKKTIKSHQNYSNIYLAFVSFVYIYSVWIISFLLSLSLSLTHTHTYIYIYCHPQRDLFRSIRTHQSG